ncbi:MAG TPA: MlaD family protein [Solirubrobacteraceae bacterium]|nr:MlaD family protein [Solirubrobacteraceae bacterium]
MGARGNRGLWLAALAAVVIAVATVIVTGAGGSYTIHALFEDSGQLVTGGEVQVAGRSVGSISGLSLTPDGLADVTLSLGGSGITPLHTGTRAIIRAVGQAGVDNRFVQLIPGPASAPAMRSGAELPTAQTTGIVDLDSVLDSFGPQTRAALQQLIAHSSQAFAGSGSRFFNQMLGSLDPALAELNGLSGQVAGDRSALTRLVSTGALAAAAVAARAPALQQAVAQAATTFAEVASQHAQLADLLTRAPSLLRQAAATLAQTSTAVTALRPALRAVLPVAPPLKEFLSLAPSTLDRLTPTVTTLNGELAPLRQTLADLKPLAEPAVSALRSAVPALRSVMPILIGLREYGSDLILGIFNGLGGLVSGPYTSEGHYAKLNFVQSPQTLFQGTLSQILSSAPLAPGVLGVRTHLLARCPGGDAPPAPDGSNPWIPSQGLCNPADDTPLSVDFP